MNPTIAQAQALQSTLQTYPDQEPSADEINWLTAILAWNDPNETPALWPWAAFNNDHYLTVIAHYIDTLLGDPGH